MPSFLTQEHILAAIILTAIIVAETLLPFRAYLNRASHYGKNIAFAIANGLLTGLSCSALSVCALAVIENNQIGVLRLMPLSPWMTTILSLLAFDFWIYIWHRMNHAMPFLWRFHQVHHNDLNMDMSTALRFHPGEIMMASILNTAVFMIVGMGIEHIILYKGIFHANVMLQHSNIGIPERIDKILRLFIVTPNMHRVHHSIKQRETDSNFSSVLTIWDRALGTFCDSDPNKIVFGLEIDRAPECQTVPYLMKLPFRRTRQIGIEDARRMIEVGGAAVIDIRKRKDFEQSRIDGALSLDAGNLNDFIQKTDKSKPIICYCYKGISSKSACGKLAKAGFRNVYNLKGGFDAWKKA